MATISLCMIVKNEEEVLARCLSSAQAIVDEIIIIDTGSTDSTMEIARRFTDKVFCFTWIDDFSAARNASFSKATMDFCMWLDADDVLEEKDRRALAELKANLTCDVVMMKYHTAFDANGNPTFTYYRERLIRRKAGLQWQGAVHEAIVPMGKILYSNIAVCHRKLKPGDPLRNLRIYQKELAAGKELEPRDRFYYARELSYHERYAEAISVLLQLLENGEGWQENLIEACRLLAECYKKQGEQKKAMEALLHSFTITSPRAEICCDLGDLLLGRGDYATAVFWYETALKCPRDDKRGGFVLADRYGVYPALQLCVCCYRMGQTEKAAAWNEAAATFDPKHPSVVQNRAFFSTKKSTPLQS